jgi:hypothetical protein
VVVAVCALGVYYWGAYSGVPAHKLDFEDDESETSMPVDVETPVVAHARAWS